MKEDHGGELFSFRVELSMPCPRCDRPVPIDGPVESAHCMYCQNDMEIGREYWQNVLADGCAEMQGTTVGQGSGSMMFGANTSNLTLGRLDPYCNSCKTDFLEPWSLESGTIYECRKCGAGWPVQEPPGWLTKAVPRIVQLINADLSGKTGAETGTEPVSVSCPKCSGSLTVDGSSRLVRCQWCDSRIYLPDGLWSRLHGAKRKRRWFVLCRYSNAQAE